jgi:hypothetical protein
MITSAQEYLSRLQDIRDANLHFQALNIPSDEKVYAVDLNARTIDTPIYLSTETDHYAETVFFSVDRYWENIDLAQSTCIIQYINANGEPYVYVAPIYDLETYAEFGKILIPWCIQGHATAASGVIKYAIRFYHVSKQEIFNNDTGNIDYQYEFDYIINTQMATSRILVGMGNDFLLDATNAMEEVALASEWEVLFSELKEILGDDEHPSQLLLY